MGRVRLRPAAARSGQRRRRRLWLHRRRAADLRPGRPRRDCLCRRHPGSRLRPGDRRPRELAGQTLADLKGKKIGVAKGSSAHNLLVSALESENIAWTDIEPVYLAPADAASAFSRGAIDAWSIWDPFYAIAELKQKARPLPIDPKATVQNSFFLANRDFLAKHADVVAAVNEEIAKATTWAGDHRDEVAALWAEASGVDLEAQKRAVDRAEFSFGPLTDAVIAQQQAVADRFQRLGLIPAPIAVRDIVWFWKQSA